MRDPKYFFALFGDPSVANKDEFTSGVYRPDPKYSPYDPEPGDIIIVYCTLSYPGYEMKSPGVGIVLGKNQTEISYRYLPYAEAVYSDVFEESLSPEDRVKFKNRRFSSHWLFEISKKSAVNLLEDRKFLWS